MRMVMKRVHPWRVRLRLLVRQVKHKLRCQSLLRFKLTRHLNKVLKNLMVILLEVADLVNILRFLKSISPRLLFLIRRFMMNLMSRGTNKRIPSPTSVPTQKRHGLINQGNLPWLIISTSNSRSQPQKRSTILSKSLSVRSLPMHTLDLSVPKLVPLIVPNYTPTSTTKICSRRSM